MLAQQPGQLEPVLILEADVHQQQVWLAATDHFDRLCAVLGFAHHVQLRHHRQQGLDAVADQGVIIDQRDANHGGRFIGKCSCWKGRASAFRYRKIHGQQDVQFASSRYRGHFQASAEMLDPFADIAQADAGMAAFYLRDVEAHPIIDHRQAQGLAGAEQGDADAFRPGMALDIGQGFLGNAEQRDRAPFSRRQSNSLLR